MKKLSIIIAVVVMIAGFTTKSMAQASETTDAGAKIVSAIAITEDAALHFGTMTIPTGATDVILTTGTVRSASVPGNVTLLAQSPVAANAAYTVTGSATSTYAITLPGNGVVTITSGANIMAVKNFTARSAGMGADGLTGNLNVGGTGSFVVGATLELSNAQASGVYLGTFNVSVDYN